MNFKYLKKIYIIKINKSNKVFIIINIILIKQILSFKDKF